MSAHRNVVHISRKIAPLPLHQRLRPSTNYQHRYSSSKFCTCPRQSFRKFSSSPRSGHGQRNGKESFGTRLRAALNDTKIQWHPIPIGLGIGLLGLLQFNKVREREKARQKEEEQWEASGGGKGEDGRPKRRPRIRPTGPWFVCGI